MEDSEYNFFYLIRALTLPLRFLLLVKIMHVFFPQFEPSGAHGSAFLVSVLAENAMDPLSPL